MKRPSILDYLTDSDANKSDSFYTDLIRLFDSLGFEGVKLSLNAFNSFSPSSIQWVFQINEEVYVLHSSEHLTPRSKFPISLTRNYQTKEEETTDFTKLLLFELVESANVHELYFVLLRSYTTSEDELDSLFRGFLFRMFTKKLETLFNDVFSIAFVEAGDILHRTIDMNVKINTREPETVLATFRRYEYGSTILIEDTSFAKLSTVDVTDFVFNRILEHHFKRKFTSKPFDVSEEVSFNGLSSYSTRELISLMLALKTSKIYQESSEYKLKKIFNPDYPRFY